ncbi:DUF2142 domain-containing protein [Dorea sp.]
MDKSLKLDKMACTVMIVIGLLISFLIPTWQTPDEPAHLLMIAQSVHNEKLSENIEKEIGSNDGELQFVKFGEKVNKSKFKKAMTKSPKYTRTEMMPKGISVSIVKHLPATVGIYLGLMIGLPSYWVLQLGEVFALLFYLYICYRALRYIPVKKEVMFLIMMSPVAIQQAGSLGYDAVLLPLCFLFISYVMYLDFSSEKIELKNMAALLIILGFITYLKVPYFFLAIMCLTLPLGKMKIQIGRLEINEAFIVKWRKIIIPAGMVVFVAGVYVFRHNVWIQIIYGMVAEPRRGLYLLKETIATWHQYIIISTVGNFGWLDTPMRYSVVIAVYILFLVFAFINSDKEKKKSFSIGGAVIVWGTFLVMTLLVMLSMVNHTIMVILFGAENLNKTYHIREALYQIPYIGGLQGRYFIPFIPLMFLPVPQVKQVKRSSMIVIISVFQIFIYGYSIALLLRRYWM